MLNKVLKYKYTYRDKVTTSNRLSRSLRIQWSLDRSAYTQNNFMAELHFKIRALTQTGRSGNLPQQQLL